MRAKTKGRVSRYSTSNKVEFGRLKLFTIPLVAGNDCEKAVSIDSEVTKNFSK